ncbi:hypothetical protein ACH5RR_019854 [Cinchona calisaya]|uniref:DUF4005 domain-containing protein n=1 Tax=Cinchona calisaya TaxID=153742 RepID=A0ABD2ZQJ1_9GENT
MGKIGGNSWLHVVRKAFRSSAKDTDKNDKKSRKSREEQEQEQQEEKKRGKGRWIFQKPSYSEITLLHDEAKNMALASSNASTDVLGGNLRRTCAQAQEVAKSQQQCAIAVAMATKVAAEAAVATAQAAAEIIRLTRPSYLVRQQQQHAAILIQTAFRGYMARRALRALKGLVKLQALVRGHNVRKRAKMTLQCMQALIRLQAQACDQRRRLSCEGCISSSDANNIMESLARGKKVNSRSRLVRDSDDDDDEYTPPKKLHELLQRTKESASKSGMSLSQAFSQQMWKTGEVQISADIKEYEEKRLYECFDRITMQPKKISRTSSDEKESIKTVEIDRIRPGTYAPHNFSITHVRNYQDYQQRPSSYTASSPLHIMHNFSIQPPLPQSPVRIKPLQVHSASPRCQREEKYNRVSRSNCFGMVTNSANSVPAHQPKYMAATVSANARARSLSTPRHRPSTPHAEKKGSVKKRLSFTAPGPNSNIHVSSSGWHHSSKNPSSMDIDICVEDEQRSYMSS